MLEKSGIPLFFIDLGRCSVKTNQRKQSIFLSVYIRWRLTGDYRELEGNYMGEAANIRTYQTMLGVSQEASSKKIPIPKASHPLIS